MTDGTMKQLARFCADRGLPFDDERASQMARYLDLLIQFNEAMNLIGPMSRDEAIETLLIDSLVAAVARAPSGPILDVGTGAGLPGIPLKIIYPASPLTLVEPRRKRSTFLKIAAHRLGLKDTTIFRGRIEDFDGHDFDFVISKAFQAPTEWLATGSEFIAKGGAVVCMARRHDRDDLTNVAEPLKMELVGEATIGPVGPEQRVCYGFERI